MKENMSELLSEYLADPDTRKPSVEDIESFSVTNVVVKVQARVDRGKAK